MATLRPSYEISGHVTMLFRTVRAWHPARDMLPKGSMQDKRFASWCHTLFPVVLLCAGWLVASPVAVVRGLLAIITSPSVLLHDYLAIGGAGATLVNAGLCGLISLGLLRWLKIELSGPFIAAVYTVIGFAFFGKNVVNIWPIIIGVASFARYQGVPLKNYALVSLFGTTLAPLVSLLAFGTQLEGAAAYTTAFSFGLLAGYILPPLASHMLRFHDGFNIYNIGFTGGIIGSFLIAILRSFNFTVAPVAILSGEFDVPMKIMLNSIFLLMIAAGGILARHSKKPLREACREILSSSGRLISDFTSIGNHAAVLINMGLMGLVASAFVVLMGGQFNGPIIGGILTVVGFAAFGKHPRNSISILAGVALGAQLKIWDIGSTGVIIAGLFGTTLAPIAGQYGQLAGILAGFCHLSIVHNVGVLHGGVNLYNNGFAGGFVASFLVPLIDALKREERK